MAQYVASARIDENGKAYGGTAGDQTGKEVSTQKFYVHSKGWRVFRAVDPEVALKICEAMEAACKNNKIGYDQWNRHTLYAQAKKVGFNISKVTTACETDCSALVRVACAWAGIMGISEDFRTGNMPAELLGTGMFVELKGSKYTEQGSYLGKGDILVTRTSGHTVVVIDNGSKYEGIVKPKEYALGERTLRNGDEGTDVQTLQSYLIDMGYDLGVWGADGDFGDATEMAVRSFQYVNKLEVDGIYGPKSHAALLDAIEANAAKTGSLVAIEGGNCYVRTEPNTTGNILGVVKKGTRHTYLGDTSSNGWHSIRYNDQNGWVSGKYGKLVEV